MTTLLQMSLAGGGIIAVTALLRQTLRDRLPRAAYLCLWAAALARLLSPVMFSSPISLFGLAAPAAAPVRMAALPPAAAMPDGFGSRLWMAWLCGALACFGWFLIREIRARHALRGAAAVHPPEADAVFAQLSLRRRVCLRADARLRAPLTYGLFRPVIVLPSRLAACGGDALRFSLLHEASHIRHGDYLWKILAACAACIHWFNPLAWLLFVLLDRDLEIACDARVLRRCRTDERAAYAHSLLDFAASAPSALLANHFSQKPLEERIILMMSSRKVSIASLTLATALVLGTTSAFAASTPATDTQVNTSTDLDHSSVNTVVEPGATLEDGTVSFAVSDGEDGELSYHIEGGQLTQLADGSYQCTMEDGTVITVVVNENEMDGAIELSTSDAPTQNK